jgi:hypothetical protein
LLFSELLSACNITLLAQHNKKEMVTLEPEEEEMMELKVMMSNYLQHSGKYYQLKRMKKTGNKIAYFKRLSCNSQLVLCSLMRAAAPMMRQRMLCETWV